MKCTVIIPAAGRGERFGTTIPKQFLLLGGRPVVSHTIERFLRQPEVDGVILCVSQAHVESSRGFVIDQGWDRVEVVEGGSSRQESVSLGLEAAMKQPCSLVVVHDAVRPFFSPRLFRAVLAAAEETGAALPTMALTDTIHRVREGVVVETLDRSEFHAAQTPQCFRAALLSEVLAEAKQKGWNATDEAGAVALSGHEVAVLPGEKHNIKITYPEDLMIAEAILANWSD